MADRTVALAHAARIRLLCVDVDGVLTDAGMYYGPDGEVLKKFNTRDGMGLARVRDAGVSVAIISGEDNAIVHARAAKLKIDEVFCGATDKQLAIEELCTRYHLDMSEVAFIGDDLNDLSALGRVGLPCAVADAAEPVKAIATYVTQKRGGDGAVRELCEFLIAARQAGS
ncbi:MAG TPA: HAD-IIIA family hydrolase [Chloroflexota bacterium]|nr:HAD-IIIA family hydrolase [Chloroflexota bacterium]